MQKAVLHIITRTPLHIGAGASVGAVDQPVVRERHTRFPIIPGSSLKGVLNDIYDPDGTNEKQQGIRSDKARWLFGNTDANQAAAGALLVGEGRLLAFPVRSGKNAFAWLTSPLTLARYAREAGIVLEIPAVKEESCLASEPLVMDNTVVLEEYALRVAGPIPEAVLKALRNCFATDPVWSTLADHLVVVDDGTLQFYAENACQIADHVRIDEFTGTAQNGGLFNQENVPSECLFFAAIAATNGRGEHCAKTGTDAILALDAELEAAGHTLQLGADATTGLGWTSVELKEVQA